VLGAGRRHVDGVRPVHDDIGTAVGQRYILQSDIEAGIGVPVRSGRGVKGVRQYPGKTVVSLRRAWAHDDHPVHDLDAGALLLRPGFV
jgi:hypothetical protein